MTVDGLEFIINKIKIEMKPSHQTEHTLGYEYVFIFKLQSVQFRETKMGSDGC